MKHTQLKFDEWNHRSNYDEDTITAYLQLIQLRREYKRFSKELESFDPGSLKYDFLYGTLEDLSIAIEYLEEALKPKVVVDNT